MAQAESKKSTALWLLVLAAVIFLWWYLRPPQDEGASSADIAADLRAGVGADPDDLLIDLRDSTTAAQVATLERDLGIDLQLVSDQSADEQFYRAHVDATRADAILATLGARPEVEVAEHDAMYSLSPTEMTPLEVTPPADGWDGDKYAVFEGPDDRLGLVWLSTWDSDDDAREFLAAYARFQTSKLGPDAKPPETVADTIRRSNLGADYAVVRRGRDVAVVEGFPPDATDKLLERAFKADKHEIKHPTDPVKPAAGS